MCLIIRTLFLSATFAAFLAPTNLMAKTIIKGIEIPDLSDWISYECQVNKRANIDDIEIEVVEEKEEVKVEDESCKSNWAKVEIVAKLVQKIFDGTGEKLNLSSEDFKNLVDILQDVDVDNAFKELFTENPEKCRKIFKPVGEYITKKVSKNAGNFVLNNLCENPSLMKDLLTWVPEFSIRNSPLLLVAAFVGSVYAGKNIANYEIKGRTCGSIAAGFFVSALTQATSIYTKYCKRTKKVVVVKED